MIYTCDNCCYTFAKEENVYTCPKCKKTSIDHNNVEIPMIISDGLLHLFCNLENSGVVFAKIGKSDKCNLSKGEKYPYKVGLTPYKSQNSFTFEPINIVYNYLHYGDELVIFSFNEMFRKHRQETEEVLAIAENGGNKGCFQANILYVKEIVPLTDTRAIDLIVSHLSEYDIDNVLVRFYKKGEEYYDVTRYLEKRLRNRFPTFTKQHTLSGDVEYISGCFFKRKKFERKTIEIDFVTYNGFYEDFQGNTMPVDAEPIEIDGVKYINVEID